MGRYEAKKTHTISLPRFFKAGKLKVCVCRINLSDLNLCLLKDFDFLIIRLPNLGLFNWMG